MRKIVNYVMALLVVSGTILTSCTDSAIDDLTGKYKDPEVLQITSIENVGVDRIGENRVFHVRLNSTENIEIAFVGKEYFLQASDFTPATSEQLTNNTYLTASSFLETAAGKLYIEEGNITVEKNGNEYRFKAIIWLEDGSIIQFDTKGIIEYVADSQNL